MTFQDFRKMLCISVYNADPALTEQQPLAVHIIFEAFMLRRSDMIRLNIRENANFKRNSCCTVQHQSLRRDLHNGYITAFFQHPVKILLDLY